MAGSTTLDGTPAATLAPSRRRGGFPELQMRFLAIWLALLALVVVSLMVAPRSLLPGSLLPILPLAAFLTITAVGQGMVMTVRGIDLSVPATLTLCSTLLLGLSAAGLPLWATILLALLGAAAVGFVNGVLVALLQLNALIVTLAMGGIVTGITLWYRGGLAQEASVPNALAELGSARWLGVNSAVWIAAIIVIAATVLLRLTMRGRRFQAVGANPVAAYVAGIPVATYQIAAFTIAGLLYGLAGILVSAFIRNPTLNVGTPYLLAPIAAAVLGGTAVTGGASSAIAIAGSALFLTQLSQLQKMLGVPTAFQFVIYGVAIVLGMALARLQPGRR